MKGETKQIKWCEGVSEQQNEELEGNKCCVRKTDDDNARNWIQK